MCRKRSCIFIQYDVLRIFADQLRFSSFNFSFFTIASIGRPLAVSTKFHPFRNFFEIERLFPGLTILIYRPGVVYQQTCHDFGYYLQLERRDGVTETVGWSEGYLCFCIQLCSGIGLLSFSVLMSIFKFVKTYKSANIAIY